MVQEVTETTKGIEISRWTLIWEIAEQKIKELLEWFELSNKWEYLRHILVSFLSDYEREIIIKIMWEEFLNWALSVGLFWSTIRWERKKWSDIDIWVAKEWISNYWEYEKIFKKDREWIEIEVDIDIVRTLLYIEWNDENAKTLNRIKSTAVSVSKQEFETYILPLIY